MRRSLPGLLAATLLTLFLSGCSMALVEGERVTIGEPVIVVTAAP